MTKEKAQELQDMGMVWQVVKMPDADQRAERKPWAERFEDLNAYKEEHGHTVVPQHYPVLGNWVHQQRTHYKLMKQGRKTLMTKEKALKLAEIGFKFEVKPRKKDEDAGNGPNLERAAMRAANLKLAEIGFDKFELKSREKDEDADGGPNLERAVMPATTLASQRAALNEYQQQDERKDIGEEVEREEGKEPAEPLDVAMGDQPVPMGEDPPEQLPTAAQQEPHAHDQKKKTPIYLAV